MKNSVISVVIPVYNEVENILTLHKELSSALSAMGNPYEVIFVDDGSMDESAAAIRRLAEKDDRVRGIVFKRNYGQTAAIAAGIECAKGDLIVLMDADLQNDPGDIPAMLKKVEEGYDVVSGWRRARKDPFLKRRLPSMIANHLISRLTGVRLHDYGCTLKVYKKSFLKNINLYGEMHRFIPLYAHWMGARIAEVEVNHRQRRFGRSKYGMSRTLKVLLDLTTVKFLLGNYSTSPLYFFGRWGFFLMLAGLAAAAITLYEKIFRGVWVHKNPLILISIFFFIVATQIILMGLLAEICMRIYYETTRKAIYAVEERINC